MPLSASSRPGQPGCCGFPLRMFERLRAAVKRKATDSTSSADTEGHAYELTSSHLGAPAHPVECLGQTQTPSERDDAQTQQDSCLDQQQQDGGSLDDSSTLLLTTAKTSRKAAAAASQQADQPARVSQASKRVRHSSKQQRTPAVPLPLDAATPTELGAALLVHGVLKCRADAFGHQTGEWVADDTILAVLDAVCSSRAAALTAGGVQYEYLTCYLDSSSMTVDIPDDDTTAPPSRPQCILVIHNSPTGQGHHFSSFVVNPQQSEVHAFDTLGGRWPDSQITAVLGSLFPNLDLFGHHGYRLCNRTGVLRQTGASCGPWALWTLVAFVFNFRGCREGGGHGVDCSQLQGGALPFWRAVTC